MRSLQVASLSGGRLRHVRELSRARERVEIAVSGSAAVAGVLLLMVFTGLVVAAAHRVAYAPAFAAAWLGAVAFAASVAARRARARASRYVVGPSLAADEYADREMVLVERVGAGYEVVLIPGMTGSIEGGRTPVAVEAVAHAGPTRVPVDEGARILISLGDITFALGWVDEDRSRRFSLPPIKLGRAIWAAAHAAALLTLLFTVPAGAEVTERAMRSLVPAGATPWETEKLLRLQAQRQAGRFHACFDRLPLACQRNGFVGVGVALEANGEVRETWIARSTFRDECEVSVCMAGVAKDWFFEPIPEAMRVILPVQVLRTLKPLPAVASNARPQWRCGKGRDR